MYTVYSAGTQAFTGWRVYFSTESRNRMFCRWSKRAMHVQMRSTLGLTRRLHFPGRIGKCGSHAISRLFSLAPSSLDCLVYLRYNSVPICLPSAFSSRRLDAYTHALKTSLSSPLPPPVSLLFFLVSLNLEETLGCAASRGLLGMKRSRVTDFDRNHETWPRF